MALTDFINKRIDSLQQRRDDQAAFVATLPAYDSRHDSAHAILATYEVELAAGIEAREALEHAKKALGWLINNGRRPRGNVTTEDMHIARLVGYAEMALADLCGSR